jgi:hypothetical protein
MPPTEESVNPYQSPATVSRRALGVVRTFQVGVAEIHTVVVEASIWKGIRTHCTNAEDTAGPIHRGPCRLEVGSRERHQVQIEVDGQGRANAYVDGKLVEANLFADLHARIRAVVVSIVAVVLVLVCVFLYFWITYEPDKVIDKWIEANW